LNQAVIFAGQYLIYLLPMLVVVAGYLWNIERGSGQTWRWFLKLIAALLLTYLAERIIWLLLPSSRPFVLGGVAPLINHLADNSLPSTHAALGSVFATFLARLDLRLGILGFMIVGIVGVARVLAMLHYPQDIVAGVALGVLVSLAVLYLWPSRWA
jgi:undecaprenyl-diphosphatase